MQGGRERDPTPLRSGQQRVQHSKGGLFAGHFGQYMPCACVQAVCSCFQQYICGGRSQRALGGAHRGELQRGCPQARVGDGVIPPPGLEEGQGGCHDGPSQARVERGCLSCCLRDDAEAGLGASSAGGGVARVTTAECKQGGGPARYALCKACHQGVALLQRAAAVGEATQSTHNNAPALRAEPLS